MCIGIDGGDIEGDVWLYKEIAKGSGWLKWEAMEAAGFNGCWLWNG